MKSTWILRSLPTNVCGLCLVAIGPLFLSQVFAQSESVAPIAAEKAPAAEEKPPSTLIVIPDDPKTVDPATLLNPALAAHVTVRFEEQPLRDIVKWLQQDRALNVLVDYPMLAAEGILVGELITDHSDDAPLYLLLNRLQIMGFGWYFENDTLFITSVSESESHTTTIPYNLSDLFDANFKPNSVLQAGHQITGGQWEQIDGEGGTSILLGDVLFVRQSFRQHLEIAGLLSALRKHGRRTLTLDPPQHDILRQKLNEKVSVEFEEMPLNAAIQELAQKTSIEIRLDLKPVHDAGVSESDVNGRRIRRKAGNPSLSDFDISERSPVSLKMADRPLNAVLYALLLKLDLSWKMNDGVLWIVPIDSAESSQKTAVFDVRDLCRDQKESSGLIAAVLSQTRGKWELRDGEGGRLISPNPGVLVVRHSERALDDISKLLESYREALRSSKPRDTVENGSSELITKYYRLQKEIAFDLEKLLPELIQPATWKSPAQPEAKGTIRLVSSKTSLLTAGGHDAQQNPNSMRADAVVIANSVLIIRQTREIHHEIDKLVYKILNGDAAENPPNMMGGGMGGGGMMGGGMGGGGGGFGGGFFSIPVK